MSDMNINRVLADMRALAAEATRRPESIGVEDESAKPDFGDLLRQSIDKVNSTQQASQALTERFESGDPDVDLTEVMLSLQKASISFKAMTEVRNKLVEAYREVMNMPI